MTGTESGEYVPEPQDFADAIRVINRYRFGWEAKRNGFGFLHWFRRNEWETMTEGEALVWHLAVTESTLALAAKAEHIDGSEATS